MITGHGMQGASQLFARLHSPQVAKDSAREWLVIARRQRLEGRPFWARRSLASAIGYTQRAYLQGKET